MCYAAIDCAEAQDSLSAVVAEVVIYHAPAPLFQRPFEREIKKMASGKGRKDPAISLLLAAVPPLVSVQGLGQAYNGEIGKGLMFLGLGQVSHNAWLTAVDDQTANIALGVYMAAWVWSTIDAYRSAKRINRDRGYPQRTPPFVARPYQWKIYENHAFR
jgi:hypothetical protein